MVENKQEVSKDLEKNISGIETGKTAGSQRR